MGRTRLIFAKFVGLEADENLTKVDQKASDFRVLCSDQDGGHISLGLDAALKYLAWANPGQYDNSFMCIYSFDWFYVLLHVV